MSAAVLPLVKVEGQRCADERRQRWAEARRVLEGAEQGSQASLPTAVEDWPAPWRENMVERSVIMAICGGLPAELAERRAEERVPLEYAQVMVLQADRVDRGEPAAVSLSP